MSASRVTSAPVESGESVSCWTVVFGRNFGKEFYGNQNVLRQTRSQPECITCVIHLLRSVVRSVVAYGVCAKPLLL